MKNYNKSTKFAANYNNNDITTMKKGIIALFALGMMCGCTPQRVENQEFSITVNDAEGRKMVVTPMGSYTEATELVAEGTVYGATVPTSAMGFYSLVSTKEQSQSIIPYYVPVTKAQEVSEITFGERGAVSIKGSNDNEAADGDNIAGSIALVHDHHMLQNHFQLGNTGVQLALLVLGLVIQSGFSHDIRV